MSRYYHGQSERGTIADISEVAGFGFDFSLFLLYSLYAHPSLYIRIHPHRAHRGYDDILDRTRRDLRTPTDDDVECEIFAK